MTRACDSCDTSERLHFYTGQRWLCAACWRVEFGEPPPALRGELYTYHPQGTARRIRVLLDVQLKVDGQASPRAVGEEVFKACYDALSHAGIEAQGSTAIPVDLRLVHAGETPQEPADGAQGAGKRAA